MRLRSQDRPQEAHQVPQVLDLRCSIHPSLFGSAGCFPRTRFTLSIIETRILRLPRNIERQLAIRVLNSVDETIIWWRNEKPSSPGIAGRQIVNPLPARRIAVDVPVAQRF